MMEDQERARNANAAAFKPKADDVFGRIAGRYDMLCDIFSLGLHRRWKRRVAQIIAEAQWACMLDAAAGTGHIVTRVLARSPGIADKRHIIVSDLSAPMLAISKRKTASVTDRIDYRILDAEHMPSIESGSLDLYSMSLGLKICDRAKVLQEAHRVLKPGGRIVTLEASAIRWPWLHRCYLTYMNFCMPLIGRIATGGDASAYQYLLKGVHGFPNAEGLATEMRAMGFENVRFELMSLGIVAIHSAVKPRG